MVVAALLHDIGDMIAPYNHSELAAAVLRPYVSERTYWIVLHHGLFQSYYYAHHTGGDRNARDAYRDHPWYQDTVEFCHRWDQSSFDPEYESLPLEFFVPIVQRVFDRPPFQDGRGRVGGGFAAPYRRRRRRRVRRDLAAGTLSVAPASAGPRVGSECGGGSGSSGPG